MQHHDSHRGRKLRPDTIAGLVALVVIIGLWAMSISQVRTPILIAAGLITHTYTPTITLTPTVTPTPTITPTLMAITLDSEPFGEDETGVVLASFSYDGTGDAALQTKLFHSFTAHGLGVLQMDEIIPDEIQAQLIGQQYNASAVLWGWEEGENWYVDIYLLSGGRPENAEDNANYQWFTLRPDDTLYLVNYVAGKIAYDRDDYITGMDYWNKAVELAEAKQYADELIKDANYYRRLDYLYFYRGMTHYYLDEYADSVSDLTLALTFDPEDRVTLNNHGIAFYDLERYAEALADYNAAIALDPTYYRVYYNRALTYLALFDNQSALADLNRSAELNPNYDRVFWMRGNLHYRMGNDGAAAADYLQYERITGRLEPHMAERLAELGLR